MIDKKKDKNNIENDFLIQAFKTMLENSSDLMFIKDLDLRYIYASRASVALAGYTSVEELKGKTDFDFFEKEFAERFTKDDYRVLETEIALVNKVELVSDKNGERSYSDTSKYVVYDNDGKKIGLMGVGRDVTAQMKLLEERESRVLSRRMFEGVLEADITENRVLGIEGAVWQKALKSAVSGSYEDVVQLYASKFVHADYQREFCRSFNRDRIIEIYEKGMREFSHIVYQTVGDGEYKWIELKSRIFEISITNTIRMTTVLNDLDDEIKYKQRLKKQAETDSLTGVLNRHSVLNQIEECIAGVGVHENHALLFIDLDCFKQVNDKMGHPFGDRVLKDVAAKLKSIFRQSDILGRIGGDEFLVLLKNVNSCVDAAERAKRVFEMLPFFVVEGHCQTKVTCSVGAAMYLGDGKSFDTLYSEADRAMYEAKQHGKNMLMFFSETAV